jgi:hypothetical protein
VVTGEIEKLTPEEREFFAMLPEHLGGINMRKALRIIEQQAVEIVRLTDELGYATNREVSLAGAANRAESEAVDLRADLKRLGANLADAQTALGCERASLVAANALLLDCRGVLDRWRFHNRQECQATLCWDTDALVARLPAPPVEAI